MRNDRRTFIAGCLAVASTPLWLRAQQQQMPGADSPGQAPRTSTGPTSPLAPGSFPGDVPVTDAESDPSGHPNPRAVLKQDRKSLQHDAASLLEMAEDLKKQVDLLDTTEVLSLDLVHKAEGIEKLAHQIKTLMQES